MERKTYQIVMRLVETRISEQTVSVEAESEADARVLAKYEDLPSYMWQKKPSSERVAIVEVRSVDPVEQILADRNRQATMERAGIYPEPPASLRT